MNWKTVSFVVAMTAAISAWAQQPALKGIETADMDRSVKPCDDFYDYANGAWMAHTVLPPDRTSIGSFSIVADKTDEQLATIFADAAKANAASGTNLQRIAGFYASWHGADGLRLLNALHLNALRQFCSSGFILRHI